MMMSEMVVLTINKQVKSTTEATLANLLCILQNVNEGINHQVGVYKMSVACVIPNSDQGHNPYMNTDCAARIRIVIRCKINRECEQRM